MAGYKEYFHGGFSLRYFPDEKTLVFVGNKKTTNTEELLRTKRKLETLLQIDSTKKNITKDGNTEISLMLSPSSTSNVDELIRSMGMRGGLEREDAASIAADETEDQADQAKKPGAPQPVTPPPGPVPPGTSAPTPTPGIEDEMVPESIMSFFFKEDVGMREKGLHQGDLMSTKKPFANGIPKSEGDDFMSEDEIEEELGLKLKEFFFDESAGYGRTARDPLNYPAYNAYAGGWGHGRANKGFGNYMAGDQNRVQNDSNIEDSRAEGISRENFDEEAELNIPLKDENSEDSLEEGFQFRPDPVKQKKAKMRKRPGKYWRNLENITGKNRHSLLPDDVLLLRKEYSRKPYSSDRNATLVSLDKASNFFYDFIKRRKTEHEADEFYKKYLAIDNLSEKEYSRNVDEDDLDAKTPEAVDPLSGLNLPNDYDEIDYSDIELEK